MACSSLSGSGASLCNEWRHSFFRLRTAFTAQRLALLELLASQAAISLDHARLYADLARLNAELRQENIDRRKAEEALRASEERWSKLAENSSAGIALVAPDSRFIAPNLALQKMLGYTEDELQGRTASDITQEEDRAATEAHIAEAYGADRKMQAAQRIVSDRTRKLGWSRPAQSNRDSDRAGRSRWSSS